jgi:hypothetical protein
MYSKLHTGYFFAYYKKEWPGMLLHSGFVYFTTTMRLVSKVECLDRQHNIPLMCPSCTAEAEVVMIGISSLVFREIEHVKLQPLIYTYIPRHIVVCGTPCNQERLVFWTKLFLYDNHSFYVLIILRTCSKYEPQ